MHSQAIDLCPSSIISTIKVATWNRFGNRDPFDMIQGYHEKRQEEQEFVDDLVESMKTHPQYTNLVKVGVGIVIREHVATVLTNIAEKARAKGIEDGTIELPPTC